MTDHRTRSWRRLRVIVEVTVPPTSRATEKDLAYLVGEALPHTFGLPRPIHRDAHWAVARVKAFTPFWPMFLRKEKGLRIGRPKEKT